MIYPNISKVTDLTVFYDPKQKQWFHNYWTSIQWVEPCTEVYALHCLMKGYKYVYIS